MKWKYVLLGIYTLSVMSGCAAASLLKLTLTKFKRNELKAFTLFFIVILLFSILQLTKYYFYISPNPTPSFLIGLDSLFLLSSCLFIVAIPYLISELVTFKFKKIAYKLFLLLSICNLCISGYIIINKSTSSPYLYTFLTGSHCISILFSISLILFYFASLSPFKKKILSYFMILTTVLAIGFYYDSHSLFSVGETSILPKGLALVPFYFFVINILFIKMVSPFLIKRPLYQLDKTHLETLQEKYQFTAREMDLLPLIIQGKTNDEIAKILFISLSTVKRHLEHIYNKAEVSNRHKLIFLMLTSETIEPALHHQHC